MKDGKSLLRDGDNRYAAIIGNDGAALVCKPLDGRSGSDRSGREDPPLLGEGLGRGRTRAAAGEVLRHSNQRGRARARPEARRDGDRVDRASAVEVAEGLELRSAPEGRVRLAAGPAAVALEMDGDTVKSARIVLGQAAPVPWVSRKPPRRWWASQSTTTRRWPLRTRRSRRPSRSATTSTK